MLGMNKLENKDGSSPRIFIPITLSQIQDFKGDPEQDLNRGGLLAWSLFSIIDRVKCLIVICISGRTMTFITFAAA